MVDRAGEVFIIESGQLRTLSAVDLRDSPALRQVVADRTLERLRSEYARITQDNPVLGQRLSSVLEWAVAKGLFLETYALESRPAFRLQNPGGEMTVSFYRDGAIHCQVGRMAERLFSGGAAQRDAQAC